MSIIASEDSRNMHWTKGSIGSKLLLKMGWTEGTGLGRDRQGTAVALRAIRKQDSGGIGAQDADITGNQGWNQTTDSFSHVLRTLKSQHSSVSVNNNDSNDSTNEADNGGTAGATTKKKKKKKLVLAQNKVTAGHSRKMREAKDLRNKSDADMAAIFGGGVPNSNRTTSSKTKSSKKRTRSDPGLERQNSSAEIDPEKPAQDDVTTDATLLEDKSRQKKSKKDGQTLRGKESKSKSSRNNAEADEDQEKPKKKKRRKETKEQSMTEDNERST